MLVNGALGCKIKLRQHIKALYLNFEAETKTFSEIWIEILTFSFKKMHLKMPFAKRGLSCLGLNVLTIWATNDFLTGQCYCPTGNLTTKFMLLCSDFKLKCEILCLSRYSLDKLWLETLSQEQFFVAHDNQA